MKSITERIFDSFHFSAIGINESEQELKSLWKPKSGYAQEAFNIQDKLKNFMKGYKGKISLTNKGERGKFFKAFIATLTFGSSMKNLQVLKEYGIATEEGFAALVLGSQAELEKNKFNTSCIKNFDPSKLESELQEWKKTNGGGHDIEDPNDQGQLDDRILIVYSRWEPEIAQDFPFKGKRGKSTDHDVNMARAAFGKDHDVKYYDCYPILAKNYFGHIDEIKKRAELGLMDQAIYQEI